MFSNPCRSFCHIYLYHGKIARCLLLFNKITVVHVCISCYTRACRSCRGQLVRCPRCCCSVVAWKCSSVRILLRNLALSSIYVCCFFCFSAYISLCKAYVSVICKANDFLVASGCTCGWICFVHHPMRGV